MMKLLLLVFFVIILPIFIVLRFIVGQKRIPLKAIDEALDGEIVRVVGEIQFLDEHLIAPLTGRACVAYEAIVDHYEDGISMVFRKHLFESPFNSRKIIGRERKYCNFLLKNGDELALIKDLSQVEFKILRDYITYTDFSRDPDSQLSSFLKRKKIDLDTFWHSTRNLRGVEGVFAKNEIIAVQGLANWEWADEHGLNLPTTKILVIRNAAGIGVIASNEVGAFNE